MINKISRLFKKFAIHHRPKKKILHPNNASATEEFERCVICGKLTCIPISMPVDWRENYEIGLGQICAECAKKEREVKTWGNRLTTAQIMLAVEQSRKENNK